MSPGDRLTTEISYCAASGAISIEIRSDSEGGEGSPKVSRIVVPRPFPDGDTFASWRDFFEQGTAACTAAGLPSAGAFGRPMLDIEYKGAVNLSVLRALCPFRVEEVSGPGFDSARTADWRPSLFCPRLGESDELSSLAGGDGVLRTAEAYMCTRRAKT